jgi:hypothetical protein
VLGRRRPQVPREVPVVEVINGDLLLGRLHRLGAFESLAQLTLASKLLWDIVYGRAGPEAVSALWSALRAPLASARVVCRPDVSGQPPGPGAPQSGPPHRGRHDCNALPLALPMPMSERPRTRV